MAKFLQLALRKANDLTRHAEELKTFVSTHSIDVLITTRNHRHQNAVATQTQVNATNFPYVKEYSNQHGPMEYNSGDRLPFPA
jgi:hypothetical protein